MDCIIHGILQARILEWVAFPFFRGSSKPRDVTQVPLIEGRLFTNWAPREAQEYWSSLVAQLVKNLLDLVPELGRSPGEGNSCPLQYSGLENSMDYSMGLQRVRA